jgi:hypothetical protein
MKVINLSSGLECSTSGDSNSTICGELESHSINTSNFRRGTKNQAKHRAAQAVSSRPYVFKKKAPPPGSYPANFSPYRLSVSSSSNNAVRLTPAEVYYDCKKMHQAIKDAFSSEYFAEEGGTGTSQPETLPSPKIAEPNSSNPIWSKRAPASRSSGRKVLSSLQLPIPRTIQEERKQLREALKASAEESKCFKRSIGTSRAPRAEHGIVSSSLPFEEMC